MTRIVSLCLAIALLHGVPAVFAETLHSAHLGLELPLPDGFEAQEVDRSESGFAAAMLHREQQLEMGFIFELDDVAHIQPFSDEYEDDIQDEGAVSFLEKAFYKREKSNEYNKLLLEEEVKIRGLPGVHFVWEALNGEQEQVYWLQAENHKCVFSFNYDRRSENKLKPAIDLILRRVKVLDVPELAE